MTKETTYDGNALLLDLFLGRVFIYTNQCLQRHTTTTSRIHQRAIFPCAALQGMAYMHLHFSHADIDQQCMYTATIGITIRANIMTVSSIARRTLFLLREADEQAG